MKDIELEYNETLKRVFVTNDSYIRMDGISFRNKYLRDCWFYAQNNGWLKEINIELDQETFIKGYLTDKGRDDLGL